MMMRWLQARLREASTYGGLAGVSLTGCFLTFTFWPYWRWLGYAAGVLFIIQSIKAEHQGK